MRILVLSFYFKPDLSAGSFRATALVDALHKLKQPGLQIDVITTQPNRYHSFAANPADAPAREEWAGLSIARINLPPHKNGLADQSKAFLAYARWATMQSGEQDYDLVFATSSRLMTAVLGAWIARKQEASLYLDIRDIFVDTIKDVFPNKMMWVIRPVFARLEKWAISRAAKVNLVSAGFAQYFTSRYPRQQFAYFTNGIDDEFLTNQSGKSTDRAHVVGDQPLTVLYAGNLGEGQGMHMIIPRLAERMGLRARFKIVGDGGKRSALDLALKAMHVTNVELLPPMKRHELLEAYRAADVLFLHLNDYDAFKKVLPSKLFEYAALGKPVWAGVAGYAAEFVTSEIGNSAVFRPCDVDDAVRSFGELTIHDEPRTEFVAKYARSRISNDLAADILAVARGGD